MAASRSVLSFVRHAVLTVCASIVCVLVASCTVPATQLLVSIDTDFYVPGELDTIRVRVLYASDVEGSPEETRAFTTPPPLEVAPGTEVVIGGRAHAVRRTVDFMLGEGASGLPIELSLVPASGDDERVALIEAFGMKDGVVRAIGSVRSRFARHRTARVSVFVFVACADIACPAESTCGAGGACIPNQIEPSCLDDPRLCLDASAPPRDAAREDASIAMIDAPRLPDAPARDAFRVDAPARCGDGVWAPETEECDGSADCDGACRLRAPPVEGTCASPIVLPTWSGRQSGTFEGRRDSLLTGCIGGRSEWGRDVVYAVDLGATSSDVRARLMLAGASITLSPTCPTTGAEPRFNGGACTETHISDGEVEAHGMSGLLYVILDEVGPTDYASTYDFVLEAAMPLTGTGTCADPIVTDATGLLLAVTGTEADALDVASAGGRCAGAAGAELWFDEPTPASLPHVNCLYVSSDDEAVVATRVLACGGAATGDCAQATPGTPGTRSLCVSTSAEPSARWAVDGILPTTRWIGFSSL